MIDIIISYLPRKVNIAFSVISAWCIMLSRDAHRASANNAADHMTSCRGEHCSPVSFVIYFVSLLLLKSLGSGRRGRRPLHYSLITYHYSLFLKNSGNLLRYVL